jgi:GT2 family glycosyltransferase
VRYFTAARRERRRYLMEEFKHDRPQDVDWISGGAMLVRRSAIAEVGPMDERFFLYMEDVDWCRRFWRAGWSVHFSPTCTVVHNAQHQSLRGGIGRIVAPHTRYHLSSLFKYLLKYHGRSARPRVSSERRQSAADPR